MTQGTDTLKGRGLLHFGPSVPPWLLLISQEMNIFISRGKERRGGGHLLHDSAESVLPEGSWTNSQAGYRSCVCSGGNSIHKNKDRPVSEPMNPGGQSERRINLLPKMESFRALIEELLITSNINKSFRLGQFICQYFWSVGVNREIKRTIYKLHVDVGLAGLSAQCK